MLIFKRISLYRLFCRVRGRYLAQLFLIVLSESRLLFLIYSRNVMGNLLYTIAVILIIIWLLGFLGFNSFGMGNLIHVLLVIAIIAVVLRLIQGRGVWSTEYWSISLCDQATAQNAHQHYWIRDQQIQPRESTRKKYFRLSTSYGGYGILAPSWAQGFFYAPAAFE